MNLAPVVDHDHLTIPISFSIPAGLRPWVDANGAAKIILAVKNAVAYSLDHPDTKMVILTRDEVKRRVNLCLNYLQICYNGIEGITMTQLCDIMPGVLVDSLRQGQKVVETLSEENLGSAWAPTLQKNQKVLMDLEEELQGDPDPEIMESAKDLEKDIGD